MTFALSFGRATIIGSVLRGSCGRKLRKRNHRPSPQFARKDKNSFLLGRGTSEAMSKATRNCAMVRKIVPVAHARRVSGSPLCRVR